MLPMGTPLNAIVFAAAGKIKMKQMAVGFALNLVSGLLIFPVYVPVPEFGDVGD